MGEGTYPYEEAAEYLTDIKGWVCKTCRRYAGEDERLARYCCAKDMACECGNRMSKHYTKCDSCRAKANAERHRERMEKAELVEYDGPFLIGDEWFDNIEYYLEHCEDEGIEPDEFAFVPTFQAVYFDLDRYLENACDDHHEDAYDQLTIPDSLKAAVAEFNKLNKTVGTYYESHKQKFRIKEATNG